ncbi:hypothetical protein [Massilia sp. TSP1-1-2]|uniref:hypothetical protein n=1 Tax=Massilia sp. TSP1-1-2 TaxID=2804649 RepID=UPI003CFA6960
MQFETLAVSLDGHIATIALNRPEKANAMNLAMWHDIRSAFKWVDATPQARAWRSSKAKASASPLGST